MQKSGTKLGHVGLEVLSSRDIIYDSFEKEYCTLRLNQSVCNIHNTKTSRSSWYLSKLPDTLGTFEWFWHHMIKWKVHCSWESLRIQIFKKSSYDILIIIIRLQQNYNLIIIQGDTNKIITSNWILCVAAI